MGVNGNSEKVRSDRHELIEAMESEYRVPQNWMDGPVRNPFRKVTDKCCLILFLIFVAFLIVSSVYAMQHSDPRGIRKVYDSSGNVCGEGKAEKYPLLYLQTFTAPYKSTCVSSCPSFNYNELRNKPEEGYLDAFEFNSKYAGPSHTGLPDMTEKEAFAFNHEWANGFFTKSQWESYLDKMKVDCLINDQVMSCQRSSNFHIYDSYPVINAFCEPLTPKAGLMFNRVESRLDNGDVGDMLFAMPLFGYCSLFALVASLVFLIVTTCCPGIMTWLIFLGTGLTLLAGGAVAIGSLFYTGPLNNSLNPLRVRYLHFFASHQGLVIAVGVILILTGLFVLFLMCKHRKNISASVPLIKVASRSTLKNPLLIVFSIITLVMQLGILWWELQTIISIYALGKEQRDVAEGSPFVSFKNTTSQKWLLGAHVFGLYWLIVFLNNFNDFLCAAVAVNFYWTSRIENIRVFCHTLGHSIGSIAFSLVILPAMIIKVTFGWLDYITSSDNPNCLQRATRGILCPCCWVYERFIDVISESAFALVYMGSEDFWVATKRYYYLSEKYHDLSSTVALAGLLFQAVSKGLIVFGTAAFGYFLYKRDAAYQQNIDNVFMLLAFFALVGFAVGSLFVNLFSTTYDAVLACFLAERNVQDLNGHAVSCAPEELRKVLEDLRAEQTSSYIPLS